MLGGLRGEGFEVGLVPAQRSGKPTARVLAGPCVLVGAVRVLRGRRHVFAVRSAVPARARSGRSQGEGARQGALGFEGKKRWAVGRTGMLVSGSLPFEGPMNDVLSITGSERFEAGELPQLADHLDS